MHTQHSQIRMQQRGIPPLIDQWLDLYGDEQYDGQGHVKRYFSKQSIRKLEQDYGREPLRKLREYLDAYKLESVSHGTVVTVGHLTKRIHRR